MQKWGSVTRMGSDRGFIYIIFGLGASHMGIWARPSPAHGLGPTPPFIRTTAEVVVRQIVEHGKIGRE